MRRFLSLCAVTMCFVSTMFAQDAVKADPKHYSVISENDQVRVLKIHYGPHEKSVMHSHPQLVAVFLSDSKGKFWYPDGKSEDMTTKSGQAMLGPAVTHLPENVGDTPLDGILVELKTKAAPKPAMAKSKAPAKEMKK